MKKRGQITLFIIICIVIVFEFAFLFYISNSIKQSQLEQETQEIFAFNIEPINTYVSSCLDISLKEGILYAGLDETNLNKYLTNHLAHCNLQTFKEQGFKIQEGRITSNVQISDKVANVEINYPLTISKGKTSARINEFTSQLSLQEIVPITNQQDSVNSDDDILQVDIPANVNALLDNNPISDIQINTISSDNDPNIFSPVIYKLQPSGATFDPPLILKLDYTNLNLPVNFDVNSLKILIREEGTKWKPLVTDIDTATNTLSAELSHFSEVGIGSIENEECYEELNNIVITEDGYLQLENNIQDISCATYSIPNQPYCKTTGRVYITDMAVWNDKLYFGTNDHSSCEDKGEVYEHPCNIQNNLCSPIGDFDYFKQQGIQHVRYGNDNILVPGLDPTSGNNYELFVYDGSWHRHKILPDPGGHLVDAVYFNGKYYVLTNHGLVVVKNPTDYNSGGTRLPFEAESYEQKLKLGPAQPTSLTVWNNLLYLTGPKQGGCNPKEDPNCQIEYFMWGYNGEGSVKDYDLISYPLNLGISKEFKGSLFVAGNNGGLYKTEDGENFNPVEFFNDFVPSSEETSRRIAELETVNGKLYVAVMVGNFNIPGEFNCNDKKMSIGSMMLESYEIYSSKDGKNWIKEFSKNTFVKNYPDINFPIVNYNNQLFLGLTDSFADGEFLQQFGNIYKSSIRKEGYLNSKPYNLGNITSGTISWLVENSNNAEIKFQIRTAKTKEDLPNAKFIGPDKSENTFFTSVNSIFYPNNINDNWVQFKMELIINDESEIPLVKEIHLKRNDIDDAQHQICITTYS